MTADFDREIDLLLIGSGGGAMTAAIAGHHRGLSTLVVEKTDRYGGTTAMSGGTLWIPCNAHMAEAGIPDTPQEAMSYLQATVGDRVPRSRLEAYVRHGPEMIDFLERETNLRFVPCRSYPDYYPELPGGKPGARTLEPAPFDGKQLGVAAFERIRPPHPQQLIFGRVSATVAEAQALLFGGRAGKLLALRLLLRYGLDVVAWSSYGRSTRLTLGSGLIAGLRKAMMDKHIPLWLGATVKALIVQEGTVVGAIVERDHQRERIRARAGVIVAAGGFALNLELRRAHGPKPASIDWTVAARADTGDAVALAEALDVDLDLMDDAWWTPSARVPGHKVPYNLIVAKGLPHSILVNKLGRRFVNECAPYVDVVKGMYDDHAKTGQCVPAYLIVDGAYRRRYPLPAILPAFAQSDTRVPASWWDSYVFKADTLAGLATKLGIDVAGLSRTVEAHNRNCVTGEDLEFCRGRSLYDRYHADPNIQPNPTLGPISTPPYYAIHVWPGDLGTKGGFVTDARARVLRRDGHPVNGLYAIGNSAASVMGHAYPGAGSTIGPAMTFGYIAALDAAGAL